MTGNGDRGLTASSLEQMEDYNSKPAFGFQNSRNANPHEIPFPSHSWSLEMLLRRLKAIDVKRDDKFASVLEAVGEFGTFQWRLVALTFIPSMLSSYFMLSDHFMLTDQKPYCNTSWILAVGPNLSTDEQLNLTLPRAPNGSFLTCLMYIPVPWDLDSIINSGLNYTETCKYGWIYPYAKTRSLINEVCLCCVDYVPRKGGPLCRGSPEKETGVLAPHSWALPFLVENLDCILA